VNSNEIIVRTGVGAGDCGYKFKKDQVYAVFARGRPLSTSHCTNTSPLDEFPGGIEALEAVAHAPVGGRLFGTIRQVKPSGNDTFSPQSTMQGIQVIATGPESRTTISDEAGRYSFSPVKGGKYSVRVLLPTKYAAAAETVSVPERGCAIGDVLVRPNTIVRGRVLDSNGRGLPNIGVKAVPWESRNDLSSNGELGVSDRNGYYEIRSLFPGKYLVVASFWYAVGYDRPAYRMKFYADSAWRDQASAINIVEGSHVTGIDFTLEGPLGNKGVKIEVNWPDGRHADRSMVVYAPSDHPSNPFSPSNVDQHGSATIDLLDRTAYLVCAHGLDEQGKPFRSRTVVLNTSSAVQALELTPDTPGFGECPSWRELAGGH